MTLKVKVVQSDNSPDAEETLFIDHQYILIKSIAYLQFSCIQGYILIFAGNKS